MLNIFLYCPCIIIITFLWSVVFHHHLNTFDSHTNCETIFDCPNWRPWFQKFNTQDCNIFTSLSVKVIVYSYFSYVSKRVDCGILFIGSHAFFCFLEYVYTLEQAWLAFMSSSVNLNDFWLLSCEVWILPWSFMYSFKLTWKLESPRTIPD